MTSAEHWQALQRHGVRFMRDPIPTRLGNLASTLARLATSASVPERRDTVDRLLLEAEYLIDCTGPEVDPQIQPHLVDMQRQLARWRRRWSTQGDAQSVAELAGRSREYSRHLLEWSGLLE